VQNRAGQAILAASVSSILVGPPVVYSQGASQRASYHNLAPDQFFTQAERDLIERVRQRLRENRPVAAYADEIQLTAERGRITLSGTVKSKQEREELAATARRTKGVTTVENHLQVTGSAATRKLG
jgi:osmotically-inducible protein OsmY